MVAPFRGEVAHGYSFVPEKTPPYVQVEPVAGSVAVMRRLPDQPVGEKAPAVSKMIERLPETWAWATVAPLDAEKSAFLATVHGGISFENPPCSGTEADCGGKSLVIAPSANPSQSPSMSVDVCF